MDTVIGRISGKVLVTMVERKTRYLKVLLAENKKALKLTTSIIGEQVALFSHAQFGMFFF